MSKPSRKIELQRKTLSKITLQYVLAVTFIAIFSILAFVINREQYSRLDEDFKTINISGRQRVLSQQIALLAGRDAQVALKTSIKELKAGLIFLDTTRFLQPNFSNIYHLYNGEDGIKRLSHNLIQLAEDSPLNKEEIFIISQKLLKKYDQVTLLKQNISESEFHDRAFLEMLILTLTLVLLILVILFIFRPMTKEVASAFHEINSIEEKALDNARLAMIGEAASSIGHEISTPLTVISMSADSILRKESNEVSPSLVKKVQFIQKHSQKIEKILHALKTQARFSNNDSMNECDLRPIIQDALEMFQNKFEQGNIAVNFRQEVPTHVHCRKSAISQVIANLISNAIDAVATSENKNIEIVVLTQNKESIVRITDSGPGVPENFESKIFDAFITTKPEGKGTGLGLAISKKIMEEHGGELRLNTAISRSCFDLIFPTLLKPESLV